MRLTGRGGLDIGGGGSQGLGDVATKDAGEGLAIVGGDLVVDTEQIASVAAMNALVGGLLWKPGVIAAARTNVALSGLTVDGITVPPNTRVMCLAQSDLRQNGPWLTVVGGGAWVRPPDIASEMMSSAAFPVVSGDGHVTGEIYFITTADPITPDVTPVSLARATMTITADGITDLTTFGKSLARAADADAGRTVLGAASATDTRIVGAAQSADLTVGALRVSEVACTQSAYGTDKTTDDLIGGLYFAPDDYPSGSKTRALSVTFWARLGGAVTSAVVTVVDITTGTAVNAGPTGTVASATVSAGPGAFYTIALAVPGAAKAYAVNVRVGNTTYSPSDVVTVTGLVRRLEWSP